MAFGDIVRAARHRRRLTQRALARQLGVSFATVAQWERGYARPGIDTRIELAQALDIPIEQLLPEAADSGRVVVSDPLLIEVVRRLERLPKEEVQLYLSLISRNPASNPPDAPGAE